jgi:hypothetical protein
MRRRYPRLSDYDRDPDATPQARQARGRLARPAPCAPGTGPEDVPLGSFGVCWCGEKKGHDWPGRADGAPHPGQEHPREPADAPG